jgi:ABC-2 type transport system ATP-binding protein
VFPGESLPHGLAQFGEVLEERAPKVKLRVDRNGIGQALSTILARHTVEDVSVEDPPLEEVIAEMFSLASEQQEPVAVKSGLA